MTKPVVLIISIVPELTARIAADLHQQGFKVCVLGKDRWVGLRLLAPYLHRYAVYDQPYWQGDDLQGFADYTERFCRQWGVGIILPLEIPAARLVYRARAYLTTPVVELFDNEQRDYYNNKWNFFRFLSEHGLPAPATQLLQSDADLPADEQYPVIVKPLAELGGEGIHRFNSQKAAQQYLRTSGARFPMLLQDFIPGKDYAVHLLARHGELLAWAIVTFTDNLSERVFVDNAEILELTRRIIRAMNYDGIAALDVRFDERDQSYRAIEINPRLGSSYYFYAKAGISLCGLWISNSLPQPLAAMAFTPATPGLVKLSLYERLLPFFSSTFTETVGNLCYAISKRHPTLKMLYSIWMARVAKASS